MSSDWPTHRVAELLVNRCLYRYRHLDPDLQDDLKQEGLIAAWKAYEVHGDAAKSALVTRVIQCRMIDFLRKFGRLVPGRPTRQHRQRLLPVTVELSEADAVTSPVFADRLETIDFIKRLLKGLNYRQLRLVGNICYPEDYAYYRESFGVTKRGMDLQKRKLREALFVKAVRLGWEKEDGKVAFQDSLLPGQPRSA